MSRKEYFAYGSNLNFEQDVYKRQGLTRAGGFECVGHCEIDKYANRSYNALFDLSLIHIFMRIDNAIPSADTAHSLELGMIRCVDDIREQVRRETGLSLTDAQIENMLAGQPCTVSDTVRDIVNKQGRKYTEHLLSATMEAGFDLHAIPAVLLGGGASVVSRHLSPKDGLCKTIFLLDDKVNAVGFCLLYTS